MNIYLASKWSAQMDMRIYRAEIVKSGHFVTSRWLDAERDINPTPEFFMQHGAERARQDLDDIDAADMLVLDLIGGRGRRAGSMVEFGYAIAKGKRIVVVGEPDDVFTQLAGWQYKTWKDFLNGIQLGVDTTTIKLRRANDVQVGGEHYVKYKGIQPWDVFIPWNLNAFQAMILKYVVRYRDKNGVEDLKKAAHYLEKLIEVASK